MSKIQAINSIEQLEKLTGIKVPDNQREEMQKVIQSMPVRLTDFLIGLCKKSPAVALQFLPNIYELQQTGCALPWVGVMDTGIQGLERMYVDRCIIMPFNQCPAYCRFCFRKFYEKRSEMPMSYADIDKALQYIQNDKRLKEVLITGGDPLMDLKRLEYILSHLRQIGQIRAIRIGTRSVMYDPDRITGPFVKMLLKYHDLENMKPIEIATHFNHPAEITEESKKAITKLAKASIRLYNQTVLLRGINDEAAVLMDLFEKLRLMGIEIYYLFHCEPVKGIGYLRTTIEKGLELKKCFRGGLASGRINPAYMVDTKIGKVEIGVDGYVESREGQNVWIKTPYKLDTYKSVFPRFSPAAYGAKVNNDGYISIKYLDGEESPGS
jgi:lysine 2,3-aminomutase